jgi:uncharacterized protein involved in exopolysaccharide biosynthesis
LELWGALWSGKWLIIGVALAFAVAAAAYSLILTPIYRSEAVLAPVSRNGAVGVASGLNGLASLAGINLGSGGNGEQYLALLRSNFFIEEFIQDKHLLPILYADQWNEDKKLWKSSDPNEQPNIRDAVTYFAQNVRFVTEDRRTGLVTFAVEWKDPNLAAEWATGLVERINEMVRSRELKQAQDRLVILNAQLAKANLVELRQAIARVIEDQVSTMTIAQAESEYAFKVIDPPVVPNQRVRPRRTLIVILAGICGGFVGVTAAFVAFGLRARSQ